MSCVVLPSPNGSADICLVRDFPCGVKYKDGVESPYGDESADLWFGAVSVER